MVKKVIKLILYLLIIIAITYIACYVNRVHKQEMICSDVSINIIDSINGKYIKTNDIIATLNAKKINPKGEKLNQISTSNIERELYTLPLVDEVQCYKTPKGNINIDIKQRIPFIKIYNTSRGEKYYIDNKGEIMPKGTSSTQPVIVASGNINKDFAKKELYSFGVFINSNDFWSNQILQIYVISPTEIELIPRVGDHIIYIGSLKEIEFRLDRLKRFYTNVLNKIGWDEYKTINIEFSNQIICSKKKK